MPDNYQKLMDVLKELFQLDAADLDFGIYRIMNQKRQEITDFLERDLLPQVRETLRECQSADVEALGQELARLTETITAAGMHPDDSPKVQELRARMAECDTGAVEEEVFSHLAGFFRRYYKDGDFLSLRRYKADVYAIPYEGEEVKLHWANADQYYVKTTEYFRDYTFRLPSGRRAHFKLADADTERDNNRAQQGKERRFVLAETAPVEEGSELVIRFEYRHDERKQDALTAGAVQAILAAPGIADWLRDLRAPAPTEKNTGRTLLEKHLVDYTRRNEFDYFIHKDLGKFLRRELDFYIKNEVVHLDDIEDAAAPRVEQYLSRVKALRRIGGKIITFLAQLEDFQKRLWLKKKFVVETNYCVTLDRIPKTLYPQIIANTAQIEEWKRLFAIEDIPRSLTNPGYSDPLTKEFLIANPYLVVDTRYFLREFTETLLASEEVLASATGLDVATDGVLVNSENFQALQLLTPRYSKQIRALYIDPPYNTSGSEIIYKNGYKDSSWLCLAFHRIIIGKSMLKEEGIQCTTIDDAESALLHVMLSEIWGDENYLSTVTIRSKPQGRAVPSGFSPNHEYAIFFANSSNCEVGVIPRDERRLSRYSERDENGIFAWSNFRKTGADSMHSDRPRSYYPIYISNTGEIIIPEFIWVDSSDEWNPINPPTDCAVIYPIDDEGSERVWSWGWDRTKRESLSELTTKKVGGQWQIYRKYRPNQEGALPGTWWDDAKYSASESGTKVLRDILGISNTFSYPKSIFAVEDCLRACNAVQRSIILDYFAGSGTTGHAVINLNREDNGKRKCILIEMGTYFDTVLKPRIMKVVYSKDWKDGKPVSREGSSHLFKYIRLESYEDTLNNLALQRTPEQQQVLFGEDAPAGRREEYLLSYMMDLESRGSASLLNVDAFADPFRYTLNIATGSAGETKPTAVDLVETFNYLLGLRVQTMDTIRGFRVVTGANPAGEKVLIIWHTLPSTEWEADYAEVCAAPAAGAPDTPLDRFLAKLGITTRDREYDLIYVNGDNNLENLRRDDETWKVRLIEEEFQRLMFDVQDV